MIKDITQEQAVSIYAAWRMLTEPNEKERRNTAFAAGKQWAINHSFDTVLSVVEFMCWGMARSYDAEMEGSHAYFWGVMKAEIDPAELPDGKDPDLWTWTMGVCDAFVLNHKHEATTH